MQYKFFVIPVFSPEAAESELNVFLRAHRILTVRRELVLDGPQSVWACCVEYLEGTGKQSASLPNFGEKRDRVDYRTVLSTEEFTRFLGMREARKNIAEEDGVPAYAIMIDEQMAQLARLPLVDETALKALDGFGEKKFERFGTRFLEILRKKGDEKGK